MKLYSRRSISPQNKENYNHQIITRRRDSRISNRYYQELTIIQNYQIPKQPIPTSSDPLFDTSLWKSTLPDIASKLFKDSAIDRTQAFKEIYIVGKQIGSGSYASVRLCADKLTLKSYALKIYNKSTISSSRQKSILREIRILQMIKHPNILQIHNVIETNNHVNLVLELIDGESLTTLRGHTLKQALYQIASALNYLHARQITHRDIKIENILYQNGQVKIIDFGFSTLFKNSIKKKIYCGTPSYMAPEIISKLHYRGPPVDIWAFGIVIFNLTQGFFPFQATNDKELFHLILQCDIDFSCIEDLYLQDLLFSMLQYDPEDRISATEVLLHPWFQESYKLNRTKTSQKSSCSKLNTPRQIHPYQQYQSTVKKHDKASIEYQLDPSKRCAMQSYMSSVASTKSPIIRRRDSGNQTFDRSSNSKFVNSLILIIRKHKFKLALLKSFKNRSPKEDLVITNTIQSFNYCRDIIYKQGFQKYQKFCEYLYLTIRKAGETLMRKGDQPQKFYIILKGTVSLIYYNPKNKRALRLMDEENDIDFEDQTLFQGYIFKELQAGDHFGDLALIDEGVISSTVICKTNCEFACMDKQNFWKFFGKSISILDKMKLLRQSSLFQNWNDGELRALSNEFTFKSFHYNQIIFSYGAECQNIYIVYSGFAELQIIKDQQQHLICRIDYGQVFGDDIQTYTTTAKCGSPKIELYGISRQILYKYFEQRPDLQEYYELQSQQKFIWRQKRLASVINIEMGKQKVEIRINKQAEQKSPTSSMISNRRISNHVDNLNFEQKQKKNREILIKFNKLSPNRSIDQIPRNLSTQLRISRDKQKQEQKEQSQFMQTVHRMLQECRALVHTKTLQKIKSSRSFSHNQYGMATQTGMNFLITPRVKKQFLVQGFPIQR